MYLLFHEFGFRFIAIPFLPVATIGTAVAFYVGFKNNSAYDRLWESRKIWGELTNVSRSACSYLLAVVRKNEHNRWGEKAKEFVYRQIAYLNLLRLQLRRANVWDDTHLYTQLSAKCFATRPFEEEAPEILRKLCPPEEAEALLDKKNIAKEIVYYQMRLLTTMKKAEVIDSYEHSDLMRLCNEMYNQQGKAERIKSFPFPRQYAYFSEVFVGLFITLLPFGLVGEFSKLGDSIVWLTIPFSILISWIFDTMEKIGDTSENPFENSLNDVPMTAICRNVEIDLRELLSESELPEPMQAIHNHLL